jgi:2-polyprenyl-3-methyl-5-hydroxy-6-metoxy-1,4-benzoquinol methylase
MGFDPTWEEIFRSRTWGRYPSEDAVRLVARQFFRIPNRREVSCLDLGCGGGAHTWFLAREGFSVTAVDGSEAAVQQTQALLEREQCVADVRVCSFLDLPFHDATFDCLLDWGAVQHNPWVDIVDIHSKIFRMLKPGGWLFASMLNVDSSHPTVKNDERGRDLEGFRAGTIEQDVFVHLASREEITQLTAPYSQVSIDTIDKTHDGGRSRIAQFLVAARK